VRCVLRVLLRLTADSPAAEEFSDNLASAAESLQRTLPRVIEFVANKQLSEL
jgi:hypothetical protein